MAQISIGGKRSYIGTYDTPKEAAIAFDRAALKANTIHRAEAILRCCTHDPSCGNAHWCLHPDLVDILTLVIILVFWFKI